MSSSICGKKYLDTYNILTMFIFHLKFTAELYFDVKLTMFKIAYFLNIQFRTKYTQKEGYKKYLSIMILYFNT